MTLAEVQKLMTDAKMRGIALHFGPSVCKTRPGQWFANTGQGSEQVYGDSLEDAICKLFRAEPAMVADPEDEDLLI